MPDRLREQWMVPLASRLDPATDRSAAVLEAHDAAVNVGVPGYRDPRTGLFVFTARFLAERGYCCSSGCRHCPYEPR